MRTSLIILTISFVLIDGLPLYAEPLDAMVGEASFSGQDNALVVPLGNGALASPPQQSTAGSSDMLGPYGAWLHDLGPPPSQPDWALPPPSPLQSLLDPQYNTLPFVSRQDASSPRLSDSRSNENVSTRFLSVAYIISFSFNLTSAVGSKSFKFTPWFRADVSSRTTIRGFMARLASYIRARSFHWHPDAWSTTDFILCRQPRLRSTHPFPSNLAISIFLSWQIDAWISSLFDLG